MNILANDGEQERGRHCSVCAVYWRTPQEVCRGQAMYSYSHSFPFHYMAVPVLSCVSVLLTIPASCLPHGILGFGNLVTEILRKQIS